MNWPTLSTIYYIIWGATKVSALSLPVKPARQSQIGRPIPSEHSPNTHGEEAHSSTSISH